MMKAQELAESILDSEIYQKMKQQENAVRHDPDAAKALGDMIEKRDPDTEGLPQGFPDHDGQCQQNPQTGNHGRNRGRYQIFRMRRQLLRLQRMPLRKGAEWHFHP